MPTYDYRCTSCKHQFEIFQSMKDATKRKCPKCGKKALERLIGTGAAVLFKGSGFYQTDYRSEGYKKAAGAESPDIPKADASPAPRPAGQPEAKPDPKPAGADKPAPKKKAASRP